MEALISIVMVIGYFLFLGLVIKLAWRVVTFPIRYVVRQEINESRLESDLKRYAR